VKLEEFRARQRGPLPERALRPPPWITWSGEECIGERLSAILVKHPTIPLGVRFWDMAHSRVVTVKALQNKTALDSGLITAVAKTAYWSPTKENWEDAWVAQDSLFLAPMKCCPICDGQGFLPGEQVCHNCRGQGWLAGSRLEP
jgi:hypothetical protein